ncbi:hypothetical protein TSAR_016700 [Trichomalopsis sarcophagae]|uniref:Endonuclease/exonuclease/phosphatase domain-containing protein n=1 Tax=Trichomalopsis sarcophagae TaxID=543379 RepID=A0A232FDC3_9HYME|nr:hypothetical protein TSAR_016700 [Trichomalopsis sarcophagae]
MAQKNQNQTKRDLRVGNWNVRSLYRAGEFKELVKEADMYSLDLVAIQESRWKDGGVQASGNFTYLYGSGSGGSLGTGFLNKEEEAKDLYYEILEQVIDQFASYDTRIVLGDFNAKIGREEMFRPTIGKKSLHEANNDNGIRVINFAAEKDLITEPNRSFPH